MYSQLQDSSPAGLPTPIFGRYQFRVLALLGGQFHVQVALSRACGRACTFLGEEIHCPLLKGDGNAKQIGWNLGLAIDAGENRGAVELKILGWRRKVGMIAFRQGVHVFLFHRREAGKQLAFEQLTDVCGVDYSEYGCTEWSTEDSTSSGFSRGVEGGANARLKFGDAPRYINKERSRFAAVYHLLSISNNWRLRVRAYCKDDAIPLVPSVTDIWSSANWYERETFDLYGII